MKELLYDGDQTKKISHITFGFLSAEEMRRLSHVQVSWWLGGRGGECGVWCCQQQCNRQRCEGVRAGRVGRAGLPGSASSVTAVCCRAARRIELHVVGAVGAGLSSVGMVYMRAGAHQHGEGIVLGTGWCICCGCFWSVVQLRIEGVQ
jgi:hypothetical protein